MKEEYAFSDKVKIRICEGREALDSLDEQILIFTWATEFIHTIFSLSRG
jgi:hypothetical protein